MKSEVPHGSHLAKTKMSTELQLFFGSSMIESLFLPFPASGSQMNSMGHGLLPSRKPKMASQFFLTLHSSDTDCPALFHHFWITPVNTLYPSR